MRVSIANGPVVVEVDGEIEPKRAEKMALRLMREAIANPPVADTGAPIGFGSERRNEFHLGMDAGQAGAGIGATL